MCENECIAVRDVGPKRAVHIFYPYTNLVRYFHAKYGTVDNLTMGNEGERKGSEINDHLTALDCLSRKKNELSCKYKKAGKYKSWKFVILFVPNK